MPEFTTQDYAQLSHNAYGIKDNSSQTQLGPSYPLPSSKNRYFVLAERIT